MKRKVLLLTLAMSVFFGIFSLYAMPASDNSQTQDMSIKASPQKIIMLKSKSSSMTNKILSGGLSTIRTTNTVKQNKVKTVDNLSKFEGRKLYGNMVYKDAWADWTITDVPYGFYSFTIDGSESPTFTPLFTNLKYDYLAGTYGQGKFYGIRPSGVFGVLTTVFYDILTTNPWALEREETVGTDESYATYDMLASTMAYDVTSNQIYALEYNEDLTGLYWTIFNKESFSFDVITKWKGNFDALAMIAVPDGNIYCIGTDGDFYSINKETGIPSLIGSTGVVPKLYSQSAVYDGKTGTILWYAVTENGSELYSVDIATGEASYVRSFPDGNQIVGIYMTDNEAVDAAPAAISDLNISYTETGGLGATVSFSIPTQTYAGQSLSGNVNLKIWIDGEMIKDESAAPGTSYSIPYNFSNDNHYITITTVNAAGISPYTNKYFYAGYDIPKAVQNLSLTIEDGNSNVVWEAPAGGVNNGYINSDSLYYNVYRYPGNELVASRLKTTTFSETLPNIMQNYFYTVIPYNGIDKEGVADSSNVINYGNSFTVPYEEAFATASSLENFTILDNNNDGQKWAYTSWNQEVKINTASSSGADFSDDWFITPRIRFEAGKKYKLTFNVRGYLSPYVENLKVCIGTDVNDYSSFSTTLIDLPNMAAYDFTNKSVEFTVPADNDYAIGFYAYSQKSKSSLIRLKKITVDLIGDAQAPDSVSNLSVVRGENDAMSATISFKTPVVNLNNEVLTSLTKVNIYRGSSTEPVHTFENPAVGTDLSWTDETVDAVGVTTYRVVAENENGVGKYTSASDFIGVYTAPYLETFDTKDARALYTSEITLAGANDWTYDATNKAINYYNFCMATGDFRLYTPAIKLDADGVYQLSFKYINSGYGKATYYTTKGTSTDAAAQTEIAQISTANVYKFTSNSQEFISDEAGKYYIGFNIKANAVYDYINFTVDSISVKKIKSSRTPNAVDDLTITPDKTGELSSVFTFKAPAYDYAGRELTSISKIDIFRGGSSIPLKSFSNPTPGEALTWTDSDALQGKNAYLILASNEYGYGKSINDTVFVGKDIPETVTNLIIKADATNQKPTLTWTAPTKGANGGILDTESLSYSIVEYNATTTEFTIHASGIKDCTYTINLDAKETQDVFYYGVVPVTNEGQGDVNLSYITLGPLFQLPFKESFADASSATEPWINAADQSYAYWTPTATIVTGIDPQDEDGGMVVYYNSAYSSFVKGSLTSPKIALSGNSVKLSFWLYQGLTATYTNIPFITVSVSTNDGDFVTVLDTIYTNEETKGWIEHTIDLNDLNGSSFLQFRFNAGSAGSSDLIYIDNISLKSNDATGVNSDSYKTAYVIGSTKGIIIKGADKRVVDVYNVSGQAIASFTAVNNNQFKALSQGVYVVKIGNEIFKAIVK
jgi:hypothetical protein